MSLNIGRRERIEQWRGKKTLRMRCCAVNFRMKSKKRAAEWCWCYRKQGEVISGFVLLESRGQVNDPFKLVMHQAIAFWGLCLAKQ